MTIMHVRKILIIVAAALLVGYLIFSAVRFAGKPNEERCSGLQIEVSDSADFQFISAKAIRIFLERNKIFPAGKIVKTIHIDSIELKLKTLPVVATAECFFSPNGMLHVKITQREPIIRVASSKGNYYVDKQAHIIPVSVNFTIPLPVATGNIDTAYAKTILYDFALYLKQDDFWSDQIEQIDISDNEEATLIPRAGNHRILVGKLENTENKLARLMEFYQKVLPKIGWNKYTLINLKFANQVVCTQKK
jgi:cell division protein FtsQ